MKKKNYLSKNLSKKMFMLASCVAMMLAFLICVPELKAQEYIHAGPVDVNGIPIMTNPLPYTTTLDYSFNFFNGYDLGESKGETFWITRNSDIDDPKVGDLTSISLWVGGVGYAGPVLPQNMFLCL